MPPSHLAPAAKPLSGRSLSFAEREEIAIWRAQRHGVREIARRLERAPSTISRELRRNGSGARARRAVEGPPAWAAAGPTVGHGVEPGTDRPPLAARLPR